MATTNSSALKLIHRAFPTSSANETNLPLLSSTIYPAVTYTDGENAEVSKWLANAALLEVAAQRTKILQSLNNNLSTKTTLLGSKPAVIDIVLYAHLAPLVAKWTPEERTGKKGYHHIVRYVDFVQNAPVFGLQIPEEEKIKIDLSDIRSPVMVIDHKKEKESKKKANAAANGKDASKTVVVGQLKEKKSETKQEAKSAAEHANHKKEKKEKKPKTPKPAAPEKPLTPGMIDLRVGHILKAVYHPNADSLYVSTIACGDAAGTDNTSEYEGQVVRTVCSGLNGLVPLEEMQGRKVVVVCNLKPVTMRGIKSAAMVLAASPKVPEGADPHSHDGPVELVNPPAAAVAGERVFFDGWNAEPEKVLNPKKKIWESMQPGFTTTDGLEVAFDINACEALKGAADGKVALGKLVTEKGGVCTVKSLKGATVR